ncbi:ATP-binding protein [Plantactinospora sp. GCM10030261]|uniref:ATP-binding protein n=1 Tax=Plantactinospora sp. GCM10030261 TaxID=3273420 RepID=UPI003608B6AE
MASGVDQHIIGREHAVAVLRAEVDRVVGSHGGLVLVAGEAGIGKTTLVTGAAEEARRRGALVLGGSCWDSDRAPGYWPWVQVIRGLRRGVPATEWATSLDMIGPDLLVLLGEGRDAPAAGSDGHGVGPAGDVDATGDPGGAGGARTTGGEGADEFRRHDAVTTALVSASQRRPVVVLLDDLHWADGATLRLLEFAARHTWFERLLLIGTYRDVEVDSPGHPAQPLLAPLLSRATPLTLTGLSGDEVGILIERTVGRRPGSDLVAEVHRRTGGNPFFVEQTARLWQSDGAVERVPPGVREAVRRRLSLLPAEVADALTTAAVLGQTFSPHLLASCVEAPVADVNRLLDRAATARLVVPRGDGRFGFAHDLVRETLYDALDGPRRRRRHADVIRAVDRRPGVAHGLLPAELAGHADLAGDALDPGRAVDLLEAAARDAANRLAVEEASGHLRRAITLAESPARAARLALELAEQMCHLLDTGQGRRNFREAATLARRADDPVLLTRVALTAHRHLDDGAEFVGGLVREAHDRLIGATDPGLPPERLVESLIARTESLARRDRDDDALTFSLWARHDGIWGLGMAREREVLTREMIEVARRSGDRETETFAASLRWVNLVEQGDPGYLRQLRTFADMCAQDGGRRSRLMSAIDRAIIATFQGDFAESAVLIDEVAQPDHGDQSGFGSAHHHLRWADLLLRGRYPEAEKLLDTLDPTDYPYLDLLGALTAAERGDVERAVRQLTEIEASGVSYPRYMQPLRLRLRARVAALTGEPVRCSEVRAALAPHRGDWLVSMWGCDISGPADFWLALLAAAESRWDEAVGCFTAARESAYRLRARPWAVLAGAGLADAMAGRGDVDAARRLRADAEQEAAELGMWQVSAGPIGRDADRSDAVSGAPTARDVAQASPVAVIPDYEFRREGAVWRLSYGGRVVHLPDAKGLRDLHLLLGRPGVDVPAVELLDPTAGPELVAARRLGADPILDDEAKTRYRRRLDALDEAIDGAALLGRTDRVTALDKERTALLDELRAAAGLAGRDRRLGDEGERARKTVAARIRDVLRKVDKRHPELADHLRAAVSTGTSCRYAPAEPVPWRR